MALLGFVSFRCFGGMRPDGKKSKVSFYSLNYTAMNGSTVSMSEFKGKKVLIINTASKCGYTPQYEELEKLHEQYKDKAVLIGFPANNFLSQEPGTNEEIEQFCKLNFGVTFPLSQKVSVKGDDKSPVFQWLTDETKNGWNNSDPKWNFYKYLINEEGELVSVFPSGKKPLSEDITKLLK